MRGSIAATTSCTAVNPSGGGAAFSRASDSFP
jgi:hypothetical protein